MVKICDKRREQESLSGGFLHAVMAMWPAEMLCWCRVTFVMALSSSSGVKGMSCGVWVASRSRRIVGRSESESGMSLTVARRNRPAAVGKAC